MNTTKKKQEDKSQLEAKFTSFPKDSNWVSGTVGDFKFEAKLFDRGSVLGIRKGRVSKLHIWPNDGSTWEDSIVGYDRGWGIKPAARHKAEYDAVMKLLENAPKRFPEDE